MAKFFYIVRDNTGKKISGFEEGSTPEEVISRLQARDLIVIDVLPEYEDMRGLRDKISARSKTKFKHYRITNDDLVLFCRQLATLLGAGVTILKSTDIISQQVASFRLYNIIKTLQKNMEGGLSLHEAMGKHPQVFSELWVNLVESGEASGNLAAVLSRLATYLERNAAFKSKVISAIIYPIILLCAGLVALLFLAIFIIPHFVELFKGFDITLPLLTRMLLVASEIIRKFFFYFVGLLIFGIFVFKKYKRTKEGQRRWERFKFQLPVFGEFFRALTVERFSSEMSTLIESGVPILYSLDITQHSVGSLIMSDIIGKIKDKVRSGKPLGQPLDESGFFEPLVVQLVSIGEEIGELPSMFKKINTFYQEYIEMFLARFAAMFEPFLLIFMGGVIAIIVIGMFLPIFQISQIR